MIEKLLTGMLYHKTNKVVFFNAETEEKEIEVLTKLKETVDKQREELRKVKREIQQKTVDVEAVSCDLRKPAF